MSIGKKIKIFISKEKMTQLEFAILCGWETQGRVNNYIYNRREPALVDIRKMADVMSVTPEWLAFNRGSPPKWFS